MVAAHLKMSICDSVCSSLFEVSLFKMCCWKHWINLIQWKCVSTCVDENSVPVSNFEVINPHPYTNSSNMINSPNLKRETSITSFLSNNMNSYLNTWSWPVLFFLIEVPNQPREQKKVTRKGPKRISSLYFILWQMLLRFDKALIKTDKTGCALRQEGGSQLFCAPRYALPGLLFGLDFEI